MITEIIRKLLNEKISRSVYSEQIIHRLITYPVTALCTFFNFWVISQLFSTPLFNFYLNLWMLVGLSQILEYALGVQIMNRIILHGYTQETLSQLKHSIFALGSLVTAFGITFWISPIRGFLEKYLSSFAVSLAVQLPYLLTIFMLILFLTGTSQLLSRVLIGLSRFTINQYIYMSGYVLVTIILCTLFFLEIRLPFSAYIAISLSPLAITFIPLALIVRKTNFQLRKIESGVMSNHTGLGYGATFTLVSIFATYALFLPRLYTDLKGETLSQFLLIFTIIGMFMNVSSSVSQVLWRNNLDKSPNWEKSLKMYKNAVRLNLAILPMLFCALIVTFDVFNLKINALRLLQIGAIGFVNLFFSNIHIVSSSHLTSKRDLRVSLLFLILHSFTLLILLKFTHIESVTVSLLLVTGVSLVFANIPTLVYLNRRKP